MTPTAAAAQVYDAAVRGSGLRPRRAARHLRGRGDAPWKRPRLARPALGAHMRTRTHVSRFADCHVCELARSLARFASPRPCPPGRSGVSAVPSSTWRSLHPQRAARNGWATHGHSSVDDRDVLLDCPGPDACCLAAALQPSFLPRQASPSKPQKHKERRGGPA